MQTVITGATGLVGANLAALLLAAGHRVRCTRRATSRVDHLQDLAIEWVTADLADESALRAAFTGADAVFHCAAEVASRREVTPAMREANVAGTGRVLAAFQAAGARRLVYTSSTVTLGIATDGGDCDESHPFNQAEAGIEDAYAITKHEAEELVRAAADRIDVVIVNPGFMLGPYDSRPSSGQLIIDVLQGKVPGYTDGYNNFVDVRDVCRGMIAAWERGRRGERYVLGGHNMTYREIMERIARVAGPPAKAPSLHIPRPLAGVIGLFGDLYERVSGRPALLNSTRIAYAYCRGFRFRSDKAVRELGYHPGPIEPGIADAITWFRAHGMLPPAGRS